MLPISYSSTNASIPVKFDFVGWNSLFEAIEIKVNQTIWTRNKMFWIVLQKLHRSRLSVHGTYAVTILNTTKCTFNRSYLWELLIL